MSKEKIDFTLKSADSKAITSANSRLVYSSEFEHLVGRLLTIADTLGLPEKQDKSFKDLVKQEVYKMSENGHFINSKLANLLGRLHWELSQEDNKRYFSQSRDRLEKGLHDPICELNGEYELRFIEN